METVCTQQSQRSYKPSPCGELENTFWVMGPEWLSQHEKESKSIIVTEHIPEECLKEKTVKNRRNLKSSTLVGNTNDSSISCVIDISRFSNLQRPWVTAHVLRFLKNLKARLSPGNEQLRLGSEIGAKALRKQNSFGSWMYRNPCSRTRTLRTGGVSLISLLIAMAL